MRQDDIGFLRDLIEDEHGLTCTHLRSERVRETYEGAVVWDGTVEVFGCVDGEPALVYAWADDADEELAYVAVLGRDPIGSPRDAVRAYIVTQASRRSG